MSILIAAVEKNKDKTYQSLAEEYVKRCNLFVPVNLQLVAASKSKIAKMQQQEETENVLKLVKPGDEIWLCDETGKSYTSIQFSEKLSKNRSHARGRLILAIGGAYGFTPEAKKKYELMKLSDFTFPHQLARLILCEQVYRALSILHGSAYHHV